MAKKNHVKKAYNLLADHIINNCKAGDLLLHNDIENIIGLPRKVPCGHPNSSYNYHIRYAREYLEKKGIYLGSERGLGYRVLDDNGCISLSIDKFNSGKRLIDKSYDIINSIQSRSSGFSKDVKKRYRATKSSISQFVKVISSIDLDGKII